MMIPYVTGSVSVTELLDKITPNVHLFNKRLSATTLYKMLYSSWDVGSI